MRSLFRYLGTVWAPQSTLTAWGQRLVGYFYGCCPCESPSLHCLGRRIKPWLPSSTSKTWLVSSRQQSWCPGEYQNCSCGQRSQPGKGNVIAHLPSLLGCCFSSGWAQLREWWWSVWGVGWVVFTACSPRTPPVATAKPEDAGVGDGKQRSGVPELIWAGGGVPLPAWIRPTVSPKPPIVSAALNDAHPCQRPELGQPPSPPPG